MSILIERLSVAYGARSVYHDFNAEFAAGEIVCLLGESGCGKTTLLNAIAGGIPYGGAITGAGKCAYVFQEPRLIPNLTVADNLRFVAGKDYDPAPILRAVELGDAAELWPKALSGGMASRLSLARAFCVESDTLLLDEPFRNLDAGLKNRLFGVLQTLLAAKRKTVVFVTHDVEEAAALGDRILILRDGAIGASFDNAPGFDLRETDSELVRRLKFAAIRDEAKDKSV